ncbi:Nuclear factor NF-kappa-B subunit [Sesamum alatum]|uniref:Nuclear factor NF-kappa-B subunit n=1 Tax=Sesamum alatum TaxID=300844 RepID=A0AAE2CUQ9_9LAMI|nr:Nuclear factor NF-kappa-B subunit [Sesamum alatum]
MEAKLFDAACSGNLDALYDVVRESGAAVLLKLHLSGSVETPLHLASMFGQAEFVREYMRLCSISAHQLSQLNQDGCSPLHLASAGGHLEIVQYLLEFGKQKSVVEDLCMKTDIDGRTALHCAVVTGKIDVIDVLFVHCPQASKEVTLQQETVLHLAVKHHQHKALEFLIDQKLGLSVEDLLNVGDREGNTILHLATAKRQLQTVRYLVKQPNLNVNAQNSYGLRALDIMFVYAVNSNNWQMEEAIRLAGGHRSQMATTNVQAPLHHDPLNTSSGSSSLAEVDKNEKQEWLKEMRSGILVMASVFATLTFQVALAPPGGLWQDWGPNAVTSNGSAIPAYRPGQPILYGLDRFEFSLLMLINAQAFFASIATIIMSIRPFKVRSQSQAWRIMQIGALLTVTFITFEFVIIVHLIVKKLLKQPIYLVSFTIWSVVLGACLISFFRKSMMYLAGRDPFGRIASSVKGLKNSSSSQAIQNTESA